MENVKNVWRICEAQTLFQLCMTLVAFLVASNIVFGMETDPNQIFTKVLETYQALETYQGEGRVESEIDIGRGNMKLKTSFSLQLQKPNLYKIIWKQDISSEFQQSGAVWNRSSQPFLYMKSLNAYSKLDNDLAALSTATGISGGVAFTIPSVFFPFLQKQQSPFAHLLDPTLEKIESVAGEDCFVISGSSKLSQQETYWISTKRYLIRQYSRKHLLHGKDSYPHEEGSLSIEAVMDDLDRGSGCLLYNITTGMVPHAQTCSHRIRRCVLSCHESGAGLPTDLSRPALLPRLSEDARRGARTLWGGDSRLLFDGQSLSSPASNPARQFGSRHASYQWRLHATV